MKKRLLALMIIGVPLLSIAGSGITICPGSGEKCEGDVVLDGKEFSVKSVKGKDRGLIETNLKF